MSQPTDMPCYRRMIDLRNDDDHTAIGWMEDDFHHFGVTLTHDGRRVVRVAATSPRYPWTTCVGALQAIKALEGKALVARASDIGRLIDMRSQCTHLHDLTGLTLAQAEQKRSPRRYEVTIPDRTVDWDPEHKTPPLFGPTTVSLLLNGEQVMFWEIDGEQIVGPGSYAGQSLQRGFREWTESLTPDEGEFATIMRRSVLVGSGRLVPMARIRSADETGVGSVCFTYQPERVSRASFIHGSRGDFSCHPEALLRNVRDKP